MEGYRGFMESKPDTVAFDTETSGVGFFDEPFCVTLAWEDQKHYFELKKFDSTGMLQEIFKHNCRFIGHNVKFDLHQLDYSGILDQSTFSGHMWHDTQALAHLEDEHRPKSLKSLMVSCLGWDDIVDVEVASGPNKGVIRKVPREKYELDKARREFGLTAEDGFDKLPRNIVIPYALTDAEATLLLYKYLRPRIETYPELWSLYKQEMDLTLVLYDMEKYGLGINEEYVRKTRKEYGLKVMVHNRDIALLAGKTVGNSKEDFNPNSPLQIRRFFEEKGLGNDGGSYDDKALSAIPHPMAKKIRELRSDNKLLTTYLRPLCTETKDNVIHPSFRQHGTRTGRMSAGKDQG